MTFLQPFTRSHLIKISQGVRCASRILLASCISASFPVQAIDIWLEREVSQALSSQLPENQVKWLETGDKTPFLAIYRLTSLPQKQGGVLIVPDLGQHPLQTKTMQGLMTTLPENGWNSLALQTPIPESPMSDDEDSRLFDAEKKRILSAVNYMENEENRNIAVISEGYSAALTAAVLATDQELQNRIQALILIDPRHTPDAKNWRNLLESMSNLPIAILDIYSSTAPRDVTDFAQQRIDAARIAARKQGRPTRTDSTPKVRNLAWNKDNNHQFRQIRLHSNNPGFENGEDGLIKNIRGWLQRFIADR